MIPIVRTLDKIYLIYWIMLKHTILFNIYNLPGNWNSYIKKMLLKLNLNV